MINEVVVIKNISNLVDCAFYVEDAIRYIDIRYPSHEFMLMPPNDLDFFEGQYNCDEKTNVAAFVYDGTFYMIPATTDALEVLEEKFVKNDKLAVIFNACTLPKSKKVREAWLKIVHDSQKRETEYQQQLKDKATYN